MSALITTGGGSSAAATSVVENAVSTVSAPASSAAAPSKAPAKPVHDVGAVSLVPVIDQPSSEQPAPKPTPTPAEQPKNAQPNSSPPPAQTTPPPNVTIIPGPAPTKPNKSTDTSPEPSEVPDQPPPVESTSFQTVIVTTTNSPPSKTSKGPSKGPAKSSSIGPEPTLLGNGAPLGDAGSEQGATHKKNSGSAIAGIVGGLSAAVLLCILAFFLWKWKTRGRYRFNKRQSFDPYSNGINANQGGLLVSSVGIKEEPKYPSDDSPTRYATFDVTREPTLPVLGGSPERPFQNFSQMSTPQKSVTFENYSPPGGHSPTDVSPTNQFPPQGPYQQRPSPPRAYQAYQEHPASLLPMAAIAMGRSPPRNNPPELFERRRPPAPPSMRRNRSPPQQGEYDPPGTDSNSPSPPGAGMIPRSHSMSGPNGGPARPPPVFGPSERHRRQRRSASLSGINDGRFLIPAGDPMHPTIIEVPSGPSTPASEHPPTMGAPRSNSMSGPRPNMWSAEAESARGQLAVRNPEPMSPGPNPLKTTGMGEHKEGNFKQLGNIVRRMSNKDGHHKVEDAAKNF